MNPHEILVLIKGEIKTEDVESLLFNDDAHTCNVTFHNGKSVLGLNPFACPCLASVRW